MPTVSVIIPLYNKAPYVRHTLDSVISQSFMDYECIIVDDSSTDNSVPIVEQWLSGNSNRCDSRFRLLSKPNEGVSVARNFGVSQSTGDFVCFLDADDWWAPSFLEEMVHLYQAYPNAGIWACNYYYVRHGQSLVRIDHPTGYMDYFKQYTQGAMPICTGAMLMKRLVFDEFGGFTQGLVLGEDSFFWMKVVLKHGMAWLNEPLFFYNNDVMQATRGIVKDKIYEPRTFLTFRLDFFAEEERANPDVKKVFDQMRVYSLLRYLEQNAYPDLVQQEIAKVDWHNVARKYWYYYNLPYPLIKTYFVCFRIAYNLYCKLSNRS